MSEIFPEFQNTIEVQNGKFNNILLVIVLLVLVLISVTLNFYLFWNNQKIGHNIEQFAIALGHFNLQHHFQKNA